MVERRPRKSRVDHTTHHTQRIDLNAWPVVHVCPVDAWVYPHSRRGQRKRRQPRVWEQAAPKAQLRVSVGVAGTLIPAHGANRSRAQRRHARRSNGSWHNSLPHIARCVCSPRPREAAQRRSTRYPYNFARVRSNGKARIVWREHNSRAALLAASQEERARAEDQCAHTARARGSHGESEGAKGRGKSPRALCSSGRVHIKSRRGDSVGRESGTRGPSRQPQRGRYAALVLAELGASIESIRYTLRIGSSEVRLEGERILECELPQGAVEALRGRLTTQRNRNGKEEEKEEKREKRPTAHFWSAMMNGVQLLLRGGEVVVCGVVA